MSSLLRALPVLLLLLSDVCRADDCKPVVDAFAKLNGTPYRITWSVRTFDAKGKCEKVTVGLSHRNVGDHSPTDPVARTPDMDLCRQIGLETFKAQAVTHYYAITERLTASVKRFESSQRSESKWEYDYDPKKVFSLF
jgi:hypothetical protein